MAARASELRLRVMSGVALAAVAFAAVALGGPAFSLAVCVMAFVVFREWLAMTAASAFAQRALLATGGMVLALAGVIILPPAGALAGIAVACAAVFTVLDRQHRPTAAMAAAAVAWCGLSALALVALRAAPQGAEAILVLFAIVWGTDIGAYFAGRRFGGPKLAPRISPGKTRSGAVGGLLAAVVAAVVLSLVTGFGAPAGIALAAAAVSVVSQGGDLFESWLKRRAGVKDSGRIIPGHGGMFDRVDGLLPAAMAFFLAAASAGWL